MCSSDLGAATSAPEPDSSRFQTQPAHTGPIDRRPVDTTTNDAETVDCRPLDTTTNDETVDRRRGATTIYLRPPTLQTYLTLRYSDRAPPIERSIPRSPQEACSSQVLPRHTRGSPYRCSLPGLAGFDDSHCVGPNLQRRPLRLIRHEPPSRGNSTPLKRIAGYRAPLTPRLARPRRKSWRRGRDLNPRHRGYPCTAFPVPHLRPLGHPSVQLSTRPHAIFARPSSAGALRRRSDGK